MEGGGLLGGGREGDFWGGGGGGLLGGGKEGLLGGRGVIFGGG